MSDTEATPQQTSIEVGGKGLSGKSLELMAMVFPYTSLTEAVDFSHVASKCGYKNAETAKKRYQQIRKLLSEAVNNNTAKSELQQTEEANEKEDTAKIKTEGIIEGNGNVTPKKKRGRKPKDPNAVKEPSAKKSRKQKGSKKSNETGDGEETVEMKQENMKKEHDVDSGEIGKEEKKCLVKEEMDIDNTVGDEDKENATSFE